MINPRAIRVYWVLVGCAALHGVALFGLAILTAGSEWGNRLWVGLTTFWFFWLVVLALNSGRSVWRSVIAFTVAAVVMFLPLRFYNLSAPYVFGWPEGLSLVPWEAVGWTHSYLTGRAEAKRDVEKGRLILQEVGFGAGSGNRFRILRERYGIELNGLAQCQVNSGILGYEHGYNGVSKPEIERRYGPNVIQAAFEKGYQLDRENTARQEQRARDLAKTISSIPPGGKVKLESLSIWGNQHLMEADVPANDMAKVTNITHQIEGLMVSAVPTNAPAFESRISVHLTSSARPDTNMSSSASAPYSIHMQVYQELSGIPDVRSQLEHITIGMRFQIQKPNQPVAIND